MSNQVAPQVSTSIISRHQIYGQEKMTLENRLSVAVSLSLGEKFLCNGQFDQATDAFDSAQRLLTSAPLPIETHDCPIKCNTFSSLVCSSERPMPATHIDTYQEDECDVGARQFAAAIVPDDVVGLDDNVLQLIIAYNKAVVYQASKNYQYACILYKLIVDTVRSCLSSGNTDATLMHLAMRSHNNMGQIEYCTGHSEERACVEFESALVYARHHYNHSRMHHNEIDLLPSNTATIQINAVTTPPEYQLEIATVLSNWCRTRWMMGHHDETMFAALEDVIRIRTANLESDHLDVAAAHFNIGRALFSRGCNQKALKHLLCYMRTAYTRFEEQNISINKSSAVENNKSTAADLDPTLGLIYVLQIQNQEKNDSISRDLVWGLLSLQDKLKKLGPIHTDVASVLNYIGTLLFRRRELNYALCFFAQELCVEEQLKAQSDSEPFSNNEDNVSIIVTCNNIGRILQELERYQEAKYYYQRSLGDDENLLTWSCCGEQKGKCRNAKKACDRDILEDDDALDIPAPAMNLYSTVWYNLGLIHDKMGAFNEAIQAFRMSLKLRRAMLGHEHSDVSCLFYNIGVLQMEQNLLSEATESFREALAHRHVSGKGQLNDAHVIRTLRKLASMHKSKGNIKGAIAAYEDVIAVLTSSNDFETVVRNQKIGIAMCDIAELHQAQGSLKVALEYAMGSADTLLAMRNSVLENETTMGVDDVNEDLQSYVEVETRALLLVGSLQHELCEPLNAQNAFSKTACVLHSHLSTSMTNSAAAQKTKSTLFPLLEVSMMLSNLSCAPEA